MASESTARLAVLIDADNAQPAIAERLLAEVAKYGTAHVKRAYGDWTRTNLKGWKDELLAQSIQPVQQFAYTRGKNATDAAMVIDAMDLLYSGRFDGFCLVSSDSDFTRLASRLRESGLTVYGFGERKTPKPFVAACDKFIYTENLAFAEADDDDDDIGDDVAGDGAAGTGEGGETAASGAGSAGAEAEAGAGAGAARSAKAAAAKPGKPRRATAAQLKSDTSLVSWLRNAMEAASDDDGWATLSAVGAILTKQRPDFDSRSYGYAKLSDLIEATTLFETERRAPADGKQAIIYLRDKRRRPVGRKAGGKAR
jgi:uncharacterized LabA/DUF88 family protein